MKELGLQVVWKPPEDVMAESNLMTQIRKYDLPSYDAFLEKSFKDPDWFWGSFFEDARFEWFRPYDRTLDVSDGLPWAKWFVGGRLNFTHNALDRYLKDGDRTAIIWEGEEGKTARISYREAYQEVSRLSNALLDIGIGEGDCVGIFLPMIPETVYALLATARIGAISIPLFSGFGPDAISNRLNDAKARALFVSDGFPRRGKGIQMKEVADQALRSCPSIDKVIVAKRTQREVPITRDRDIWYQELVAGRSSTSRAPEFDSEKPFMIIYTSGTTGRPKGTVHVHGGSPVKAAQDMFHLFDVKPNDTFCWATDIGWMMGPWVIIGSLILGASVFLYDGVPDHPAPDRMWEMVERHSISVLGITPTLIRALMRQGAEWPDRHKMPSLRILGSSGEPWNPDPWMWTFKYVGKERVPIINYSGGTEIFGGILGCVVVRPLKPTSFNTVVPGVVADAVSEAGAPIREEVSYLVVRRPNPGMTRGFWNDRERYLETYWSRFEGIWYHADLVYVDEDGFWYILGRADDTLKVAGKRIGPAELESILVEHPAVSEAAVIGVPDEIKGEAPVAFVILRPNNEPRQELRRELVEYVATRIGKAFAPKEVKFVRDLPKTRNAKIMRRVIRASYLGKDPGDLSALENPKAVEEISKAV